MSHAPPDPGKRCISRLRCPHVRIQIAEPIDFRGAQETHVHAALLQETHHVEHLPALRGTAEIRRIAHRVKNFGEGVSRMIPFSKRPIACGACVRLRHKECQHRQPHSDEHQLTIADFARRRRHHDFAGRVTARCDLRLALRRGHKSLSHSDRHRPKRNVEIANRGVTCFPALTSRETLAAAFQKMPSSPSAQSSELKHSTWRRISSSRAFSSSARLDPNSSCFTSAPQSADRQQAPSRPISFRLRVDPAAPRDCKFRDAGIRPRKSSRRNKTIPRARDGPTSRGR